MFCLMFTCFSEQIRFSIKSPGGPKIQVCGTMIVGPILGPDGGRKFGGNYYFDAALPF